MHSTRQPTRLKLTIRGAVQGVGFRPFIYRLATETGLKGWVNNSAQGVFVEVEGARGDLERFLLRLEAEKPPRSFIQSLESSWLDPVGYAGFEIRLSEAGGARTALVLPDIATCPDCRREILDPQNRRYFYPFTNCTNCGPRFSIIEALPYDRANTSMKQFAMCPQCQAEYDDPRDRRFHAQPNACPACGPRLELWDAQGIVLADGLDGAHPDTVPGAPALAGLGANQTTARPRNIAAPKPAEAGAPGLVPDSSQKKSRAVLVAAVEAIRAGKIIAVKGLGGFHLMVAAHDEAVVRRLRERKHREEKPLALMFPSLEAVQTVCEVSAFEERLLRSPEAPIVLLRRLREGRGARKESPNSKVRSPKEGRNPKSGFGLRTSDFGLPLTHHALPLAPSLAPNNPYLGVMLPYTPLHHLLLSLLGFPVVATSGNLSDEPICTNEREALGRLAGIADLFLVHNRPIVRHVDDSIVRMVAGRELVLRRARGFAPLPVQLLAAAGAQSFSSARTGQQRRAEPEFCAPEQGSSEASSAPPVLAVGAHLKNTVALAVGEQVFLSQHIGDLETDAAYETFRRVIGDFERLYEARPAIIAADAHPDYLSTKFALDTVEQASAPAGSAGVSARGANPLRDPPGQRVGMTARQMVEAASSPPPSPPEEERERQRAPLDTLSFKLPGGVLPSSTLAPQLATVQHHLAHVLSCMAENELQPPALGVSWDGTGYGLDGTVWGGEFFLVTETSAERVAHLRQFRLPGGDKAVKEPRRAALGLLYEMFGASAFEMKDLAPLRAFSAVELASLKTMLGRRLNSPLTSSIGRLFDAVASLTSLRQQVRYEGQAAMELEFAREDFPTNEAYEFALSFPDSAHASRISLDWSPLFQALLADLRGQVAPGLISAKFHNALAEAILAVARRTGLERVVLSGGCFQNRYLTERAVQRLQAEGFRPYWHQRVPPNDGGIALGQVVAARRAVVGWRTALADGFLIYKRQ